MYDHGSNRIKVDQGVDAPAKIKLVPTARRNDEQKEPPSQRVSRILLIVTVLMEKNIGASDEKSPVDRVF